MYFLIHSTSYILVLSYNIRFDIITLAQGHFPNALSSVMPACLPAWLQFKAVLHAGDVLPIHFSSSDSGNDGFPWLSSLAISELCLAWLSFPPQETADARCFWFILHSKISTVAPDTLANLAFSDCLYRLCLTSDDAAAAFHQVSMQVRSPLNKKA